MCSYDLNPVTFQEEVADLYKGQLLEHADLSPTYGSILSNVPTSNLSLTNSTWYSDLLTYHYNAGYEPAPEIKYTTSAGDDTYNVIFFSPLDGTISGPFDSWELTMEIWTDGLVGDSIISPNRVTCYGMYSRGDEYSSWKCSEDSRTCI